MNSRELVFAAGLALVAYGLSLVSTAAAFIIPGPMLVWLAIPPATRRGASKCQ
jgi:hypothetical protein